MRKIIMGLAGLCLAASPALAANGTLRVSGQGTVQDGRIFVVNATIYADGTASGHATLINHAFSGDKGTGPYTAHIDISCAKRSGDEIFFGGLVTRTNDSNPELDQAAYFSVVDDGRSDTISRVFFFDDDPATTGDPALCLGNVAGDFPQEPVLRGNIKAH
jgi:hypothetical protein